MPAYPYGYGYNNVNAYPGVNNPYQPMPNTSMPTPQPQPTPSQVVNQAQATQPQSNGILWVQGEETAKSWIVAPGTTVMLMDADGSCFYLKTVDASGMPQPLRIFDYKERVPATRLTQDASLGQKQEYVPVADFLALSAKFDALAAELVELKSKPCACKAKMEVEADA